MDRDLSINTQVLGYLIDSPSNGYLVPSNTIDSPSKPSKLAISQQCDFLMVTILLMQQQLPPHFFSLPS